LSKKTQRFTAVPRFYRISHILANASELIDNQIRIQAHLSTSCSLRIDAIHWWKKSISRSVLQLIW